jgi:hypothetical protein
LRRISQTLTQNSENSNSRSTDDAFNWIERALSIETLSLSLVV